MLGAGPESNAKRAMAELQEVGRGVGGFLGPKLSCPPAASLVPQRRSDFSQIVLRALITGAFVSLVNACVAGECWSSCLRILTPCFLAPQARAGLAPELSLQITSFHRNPLCAQEGRGGLCVSSEPNRQQQQL